MKRIDTSLLDDLTATAAASARKRAHHNIHPTLEDPVQRLCVAIEPGTYIRPHRHADPATWEVFLMLRGSAVFLAFDNSGTVIERIVEKHLIPLTFPLTSPWFAWYFYASQKRFGLFFKEVQACMRSFRREASSTRLLPVMW
jgi:hypothetical protein